MLRSRRSMIQTVGRAARNINGMAILYADKITKSMQATISETEYRRKKQITYNEKHGKKPQALNKKISEVLVGRSQDFPDAKYTQKQILKEISEKKSTATPEEIEKIIAEKQKAMETAAKNLDFILAAKLRDEIKILRGEGWVLFFWWKLDKKKFNAKDKSLDDYLIKKYYICWKIKKVKDRLRYSDTDLQEFKELILQKIEKAEKDLFLIKQNFINDQNNGTDDTSPTFKAFEEGAETLSKEQNAILAGRQEKFIRDLKNALIRIENKTYGVCRVTGELIDKERLRAVPHATLSIKAKNMQR